jgi:peptide/nickel transport system ATP-binding protein
VSGEPPVLAVSGYSLAYRVAAEARPALRDINLSIARGRTLGLVGESGSGKSSLAWAIMRALAPNAVELAGTIRLGSLDLRALSRRQLADIRGRRIAMVFQDPATSLNPTMKLGEQVAEVLLRHRALPRAAAWRIAEDALARTGIARPAEMLRRYPHEASGGEKQRVVIATAFACEPDLIVFDEPTTALDVLTAQQILALFQRLREATQVSALYISHDLSLVAGVADEVAVLHRGEVVEQGAVRQVLRRPRAAYTERLVASVPDPARWIGTTPPSTDRALLGLDNIGVRYAGAGLVGRLGGGRIAYWGARDISFAIRPGEMLGLVGESGSGKSTIAKVLAGLQDFTGVLDFDGQAIAARGTLGRSYRRRVQIVFQHPDASLNPRQTVRQILSRPLLLYGLAGRAALVAAIAKLLALVRLPGEYAARRPHQLSGGEKQRVAIARAFAARPDLVICDEITSSLDVSVQASVAELLVSLQRETGTACLFITHDLNLVRQLAHRIGVMQSGALVDLFATADAEAPERHPYTRDLLAAVPRLSIALAKDASDAE